MPPQHTHPCERSSDVKGVTLIELLVAIAVLAVLLGVGIPSFGSTLARWRQQSAVDAFVADLRLARSSATRSSRPVVMCAIDPADQNRCHAGAQWTAGWRVFADTNDNRRFDAGETEIARRPAPAGMGTFTQDPAPALLAFRGNGTFNELNPTITLQASGGTVQPQYVILNRVGRARVSHERPG